jgi:hypothetical protein
MKALRLPCFQYAAILLKDFYDTPQTSVSNEKGPARNKRLAREQRAAASIDKAFQTMASQHLPYRSGVPGC